MTQGPSGSQPPTPVCFRGNGHWPRTGAEVAGVQPSAQGQLVLQASDGLPGRQELQTGAWTQHSPAASPSHPASPCQPLFPPRLLFPPCLPGSQSPSLKPRSEVPTTRSPRSDRGSRWGVKSRSGVLAVPCTARPQTSAGSQRSLSSRSVLPHDGRLPMASSPPPCILRRSQPGGKPGKAGSEGPPHRLQDNLGQFLPQTNEAQTTLSWRWVAPVGVCLRPPSPSHRLQPQPWILLAPAQSAHQPQSPEQRPLRPRESQTSARLRLPREGVREALREWWMGSHGAHVGLGEVPMVLWVWGSEATGSGLQEAGVQQGRPGPRAPAGSGPVSHVEGRVRGPTSR